MNIFAIPEKVTYEGKEYVILDILEFKMLLVVESEKFKKGKFPIETLIIPNQIGSK